MEAPDRILRRSSRRSKWCITAVVVVVLVVVAAVVAGVAVALSNKKESRDLLTTILVPLYIYPDPGAWDPLLKAITAHSSQKFTLVINPHSGPGNSQFPSIEYITQIQNLTQYPNVQMVGYVRTGYATRDIEDVLSDISKYSGWDTISKEGVNSTALAMHGIFFDEAPHAYTPETADYMSRINQEAKDSVGVLSPKTVIHNPGTIPDARLTDTNTDITVVFEESFDLYKQQSKAVAKLSDDRSKKAIIIHSVPSSTRLRKFVDQLAPQAENLYLTDLTENYYQSFGNEWQKFVDAMT